MRRLSLTRILILMAMYSVMLLGVLWLTGCAGAPRLPEQVLVPTPIPCPAAADVPEAPPRSLHLDATKPGETVKAYAANRARWIGYGDALRTKLESCK
jgi:hypothetical protein